MRSTPFHLVLKWRSQYTTLASLLYPQRNGMSYSFTTGVECILAMRALNLGLAISSRAASDSFFESFGIDFILPNFAIVQLVDLIYRIYSGISLTEILISIAIRRPPIAIPPLKSSKIILIDAAGFATLTDVEMLIS